MYIHKIGVDDRSIRFKGSFVQRINSQQIRLIMPLFEHCMIFYNVIFVSIASNTMIVDDGGGDFSVAFLGADCVTTVYNMLE